MITWIGAILVMACWIPQTVHALRTRQSGIHIWYLIPSFLGSFFLAYGAARSHVWPFVALNAFAGVGSAINLWVKYKNHNAKGTTLHPFPENTK